MGSKKGKKREKEIEFRERKAKRNKLVTISAVITVVIAVSIYFVLSGGGGSPASTPSSQPSAPTSTPSSQPSRPTSTPAPTAQQPSGPIKATWIEPQVDGDTVSILLNEIKDNWNIHFKLDTSGGDENFMAYTVEGETYVRANVCPPCRSVGFSLSKDTLICDSCRTTFKAKTGDGISGACVSFPKAAVPFEISDGQVVMRGNDLQVAYQNTIEPGLP
ncbi:Fe-S-containing protein [Chloroflexota bacterium]